MITSQQLRQKFLDFMATKGHSIIPSASLIPKEDPTLLFVNSGMYPLVPYLMGQKHPAGTRLADSQKVIRTVDIDEVGDNRHLSFFEMLGSWSLGDYNKVGSITWGFEFLTDPKWLGLDPKRLFVTVYKGNDQVPADQEAIEAWIKCFESVGMNVDLGVEFDFKKGNKIDSSYLGGGSEADGGNLEKYIYRITKKSGKDNWWGLPYRGPCGPCSEIYYLYDHNEIDFETQFETMNLDQIEEFVESQIMEIWNHVFMEYEGEWGEGHEPINLKPLAQKNIDTGMGFERLLALLQGVDTVQKTDVLKPIADVASGWAKKN
jgi:alanyl-tRNA synthetase